MCVLRAPMSALLTLSGPYILDVLAACSASVDVALVLDVSGSVDENYRLGLELMRELIYGLDFRSDHARAAFVVYSDNATVRYYLDEYQDVNDVIKATALSFAGGRTHTQEALRLVNEEVFVGDKGDRGDVINVVVLATDGHSNVEALKTVQRAADLKDRGNIIYVVGIGSNVNREELDDVASDPSEENVVTVQSGEDLASAAENLLTLLCGS